MTRSHHAHLRPELGQQALNIVPLKPGEVSSTVRVRGSVETVRWFSDLTAAERGEIAERAHKEMNMHITLDLSAIAATANHNTEDTDRLMDLYIDEVETRYPDATVTTGLETTIDGDRDLNPEDDRTLSAAMDAALGRM